MEYQKTGHILATSFECTRQPEVQYERTEMEKEYIPHRFSAFSVSFAEFYCEEQVETLCCREAVLGIEKDQIAG